MYINWTAECQWAELCHAIALSYNLNLFDSCHNLTTERYRSTEDTFDAGYIKAIDHWVFG